MAALVWCELCMFHGDHDAASHPPLTVRGEVSVEVRFTVDLLALVQAYPDDWARALDAANGDIEEAVNAMLMVLTCEDGWSPPDYLPGSDGPIKWEAIWEPELDWNPPGPLRDGFWERLRRRLDETGALAGPGPVDPATLGMDPLPEHAPGCSWMNGANVCTCERQP